MGRRLRCTEAQRQTIHATLAARRARGVPFPEIVQELASKGIQVSVGYLHKTARSSRAKGAPSDFQPMGGGVGTPEPEIVLNDPPDPTADVPLNVLDELRQALKDARTFSRLPAVRANTREYLAALKLVAELAGKLARYLPPPPDDPNEAPDMVAAADRARAKLHEALERLIK